MEIEVELEESGDWRKLAAFYYVDGQRAGTRVQDVLRFVNGKLPRNAVVAGCSIAKKFGRCKVSVGT